MTFIRTILAMMIALIVALTVRAEESAERAAAETLPPYVIVINKHDDPLMHHLPDSTFNTTSGNVIFKVNRTELNLRAPFITDFETRVLPLVKERQLTLVGVDIRGAASPEGPYDNNVRLSKGRAQALVDHLRNQLDSLGGNDIVISTIAEDYNFLHWLLERRGDSAAPIVGDIIERYGEDNHAAIKAAMQRYDGGRMWDRLLRDYYPEVRAARVILYFETPRRELVKVDVEVPKLTDAMGVANYERVTEPPYYPLTLMRQVIDRPHMLAVSSNLLADGFYMPNYGWAPMPNIGLEYYPRKGKYTIKAQFLFPYYHLWSKNKFFQIRDYHLEVRRYFKPGRNHTGLYLGAYVNAAKYGIGLSAKKGWQGEGFGGAIKAGYILPIGRDGRWRLELHAAAGVFVTRYDPYVYGNPITGEVDGDYYYDWLGGLDAFRRRNHQFNWFGPTEVGLTLTYDLLYWRVHKKGVSMIRKEVVVP